MKTNKSLYFMLIIWALAFATAFAYWFIIEPAGAGLDQDLNRIESFFGWQIGATILAVIIWWLGRSFTKGTSARWLSRVPILSFWALVLFVFIVIMLPVILASPPTDALPKA